MLSLASSLLVLLAFALDLSNSDATTCANKNSISLGGGYSNLTFFSCLINGDNLSISWARPPTANVETRYQVEYQCYNESTLENSAGIDYQSNTVVKSEFIGQETMGSAVVPKTNSSCLVTGCYKDPFQRGDYFYWINKDDCISTPTPSSSLEPMTMGSGTTLILSSGDSPALYDFHSDSIIFFPEHSTTVGLMFASSSRAVTVITQLVSTETPSSFSISTSEIAAITLSSVAMLLVIMAIIVLLSLRLLRRQRRHKSLGLREEEAEILRLGMKNREILSLSLGEFNVILTPYTSLESVFIQSFESLPHHIIAVRQEKTSGAMTDEVHDSPCKQIPDAFTPKKTVFTSVESDRGYIYQGPPPSYDTSPSQPLDLSLDCVIEHSDSSGEEVTSFFCRKTSQSENSLDQGYITSEYCHARSSDG